MLCLTGAVRSPHFPVIIITIIIIIIIIIMLIIISIPIIVSSLTLLFYTSVIRHKLVWYNVWCVWCAWSTQKARAS